MTLSINSANKFDRLPAALLLDIDNTLYAYEPAHRAALLRARQKASALLGIGQTDFDELYEDARLEVKRHLGQTGSSHSRLLYFQRLIELAGLRTQVLAALDLEQTYWRTFLSCAFLFENVREFLDDIVRIGASVVVMSDLTTQIQFRKILHFGLDRYIDYVVTSEEAGADKPDPSIFELALRKQGPVSGPLWYIGDDPIRDVQGARNIGAVTLQKLHAGVMLANPRPDASFSEFADLRKMLARLASEDRLETYCIA